MRVKILLTAATILLSTQVHAQSAAVPVVKTTKKEKKKNKNTAAVPAVTAAPTVVTAPAVEVKKEEVKPEAVAPSYLKEKLKLSFHAEIGLSHEEIKQTTPKLDNITQFYVPTIGWNFRKDISISTSNEFKYASTDGTADFPNGFYRGLVTLTKSDILTEKENGIKLNLGVARRYNNPRAIPTTYGNSRLIATVSKTFRNANFNMQSLYLYNDPKTISAKTSKHIFEFIPDVTFKLTDKLSFEFYNDINIITAWQSGTAHNAKLVDESYGVLTYEFNDKYNAHAQYHYLHNEDYTEESYARTDTLGYAIGAGMTVAKNTNLMLEMGSDFLASNDNKTFADTWKRPDFTLYFDWAF